MDPGVQQVAASAAPVPSTAIPATIVQPVVVAAAAAQAPVKTISAASTESTTTQAASTTSSKERVVSAPPPVTPAVPPQSPAQTQQSSSVAATSSSSSSKTTPTTPSAVVRGTLMKQSEKKVTHVAYAISHKSVKEMETWRSTTGFEQESELIIYWRVWEEAMKRTSETNAEVLSIIQSFAIAA